ncbi:LacI family DNA-binding transcriptional regulator [Paenibacillus sp. EPM92]|uniref:LacI family DNA-binding transcriptional regulator n=1 Tax=Paenibacillus sp. EPM92 TaxID=1561195 RepID=UPI0019165E1A|nr:LacI family DNA-binding transcriptional regulator [Paenibacillus sp. EPM92]
MPITTKDIARIANVSQSTVSRCLNNSPTISEETKKRVLQIAQQNGFQFNANARSLSTNKTHTIGVIFPRILLDYGFDINFKSWQDELMENLERLNLDVIVSLFENRFTKQNNIKKLITGRKVDGLIILQPELDRDTVAFLEKMNVPYVFCKYLPDIYKTEEVDFVYVNQFKGGYLASEHLLNLGHKNILCISANVGGDEFRLRTEGFKSAFTDHGLEFDDKMLFFGDTTFKSGYQVIKENEGVLKEITAIFAQNDLMALGVISALKDRGIDVPNDIAVVGYDNIEICEFFKPHLTTIHQPTKELAELTCGRLVALLNSKKSNVKQKTVIEPKLVIRESCGSQISRT